MVRGDTESHKSEGHGQGFEHVDFGPRNLGHDAVRGVEAGGAGADHGHAEGPAVMTRRGGIQPIVLSGADSKGAGDPGATDAAAGVE